MSQAFSFSASARWSHHVLVRRLQELRRPFLRGEPGSPVHWVAFPTLLIAGIRKAGTQLPRLSDCLKRHEISQTFELVCSLLAF